MSYIESSEENVVSDSSMTCDDTPDWILNINNETSTQKSVITSGNGFRILHPNDENIKGCILLLRHPINLAVTGKLAVKVLWGMLDVYGFVMKPKPNQFYNIFSPISSCLLTMKTMEIEPPSKVGVMESRERVCNSLVREHCWSKQDAFEAINHIQTYSAGLLIENVPAHFTQPHFERLFSSLYQFQASTVGVPSLMLPNVNKCELFDPTNVRSIYCEDWYSVAKTLKQYSQEGVPKTFICGGKNVGKSTMLRFFINSFLNSCDAVCCIDGDPGQSEFAAPGLLSLVIIKEPCLGPGFSCRRTPEKTIFIGVETAAENPRHYIASFKDLFNLYCGKYSEIPLLINTMGWNAGIGLALLTDMINIVQPSHVIQLDTKAFPYRNFPNLAAHAIEQCSGWTLGFPFINKPYEHIVKQSLVTYRSDHNSSIKLRELNLASCICDFQSSNQVWNGTHTFPFHTIPLSQVALNAVGVTQCLEDSLFSFNGCLVALCERDPVEIITSAGMTEFPKQVLEMPVCHCYGYGFVRGISMEDKCFYISTSVDSEAIKKVNLLIKGRIRVPLLISMDQTKHVNTPKNKSSLLSYTIVRGIHKSIMGQKGVLTRSFKRKRKVDFWK